MISFYLTFIFLCCLMRSIFMVQSPFELTLNYNDTQIRNINFTIATKLNYDTFLPVNCEKNRYRLCLVELSLQIQADTMSIEFWCQPPGNHP
jgi:hypothetical protein